MTVAVKTTILCKQNIFHNANYTTIRNTISETSTSLTAKNNKHIHAAIVQSRLPTSTIGKVLNDISSKIKTLEQTIPKYTRRTILQLKANRCPLPTEYLHKISPDTHPTWTYSFCNVPTYIVVYICWLFTCQHICTTLTPNSLGEDSAGVANLLAC